MKKLHTYAIFAILLIATAATAADDPTRELIDARRVKNFIRVTLAPAGDTFKLRYGVDDYKDTDDLTDGLVFRADDPVDVYLGNFNPLLQTFEIEAVASEDPSYASIKKFLEDLKELQKSLPQPAAAPGGAVPGAPLTGCALLEKLRRDIYRAAKQPELTAAELDRIVNGAVGFAGVTRAIRDLTTAQNLIAANIKTIRDSTAELQKFATQPGFPAQATCDERTIAVPNKLAFDQALEQYKTVIKDGKLEDIIKGKERLSQAISTLLKALQSYSSRSDWRGPTNADDDLDDYDYNKKIGASFDKQQTVTVTAKAKTITLDNDTIVAREGDPKTGKWLLRQDSIFIPERAAAMVYNTLTYPKYGTKKDDATGKTVVERVKDTDPIDAAVMLNVIARLPRKSFAYPMVQIGVSSAKDFPGLLAGIGIRFVSPVAFSMSVGGMITRYKDLDDELKVGDEVTGTSDIDKHLKLKNSPVVIYGAVQIKF